MQYRLDRYGNKISALGYGCMRFSRKGANIDYDKTEREIMRAYELGVNYYDTAYIYPGSEVMLGRILSNNGIREKVNIATKLPQYLMKSLEQCDKTLNEELDRLKTDYVDYYLMHMFTDIKGWERLKAMGIEQWIADKKAEGTIRQIGFSFHGNSEMFIRILKAYDWDFCQIQYNYLDENTQAGRAGLKAAEEKGIPVIIMEPLRGGKLVNLLPDECKKIISKHEHQWSAAEWGLRWLWDQPGVTCVLSGMNSLEMVDENIRIACEAEAGCLAEGDMEFYEEIKRIIRSKEKVGCTGCAYCMPCPMGVDIPATFSCYNKMYSEKKMGGITEYAQSVGMREKPGYATLCVGCGKCESHCPQGLPIIEKLKEADKALRPWYIKLGTSVARKVLVK